MEHKHNRAGRLGQVLVVAVVLLAAACFVCRDCYAVSTKHQGGSAVKGYSVGKYKIVHGPGWAWQKKPSHYRWWNTGVNKRIYYNSRRSTKGFAAKFQRWLKIDVDNPQSITVTPDGNTLFIMTARKHSAKKECNWKGYILKIDLKGLRADSKAQAELNSGKCLAVRLYAKGQKPRAPRDPEVSYRWINDKGQEFDDVFWEYEDKIRDQDEETDRKQLAEVKERLQREHPDWDFYYDECYDGDVYHPYTEYYTPAVNFNDSTKPYSPSFDKAAWKAQNGFTKQKIVTDEDYIYRKYIKISKQMVVGHGQTLAYNPKTRKLWFFPKMKCKRGRAVMIDPNTLKAQKAIDFTFKSNIQCPSTLTFDKHGNAFCYTMSAGGWGGFHTAKIYKGTVSASKVSFRLMMSGIKPSPGTLVQGLGYNPKNNRLYLLADNSIVSVPAGKLSASGNHLKGSDIKAAVFPGKREFEDITYDGKGNGYFLVNKPDEVMLVNKGF